MQFNEWIKLKNIQKKYNDQVFLNDIDATIFQGEFISIVGQREAGKSTLLRIIAGLEKVSGGMVIVNGKPLLTINDNAKLIFQEGRLLPWKTILENVAIGLSGEWEPKALYFLKKVGLDGRADEYPSSLSNFEEQLVALARALIHEPKLLLLDEPLDALDSLTKLECQHLIETIWHENRLTAILATTDVEQAVFLSDRVIVMGNGGILVNQPISLPRPRTRANPTFHHYCEGILDAMKEGKEAEPMVMPKGGTK